VENVSVRDLMIVVRHNRIGDFCSVRSVLVVCRISSVDHSPFLSFAMSDERRHGDTSTIISEKPKRNIIYRKKKKSETITEKRENII
jgi:hypothetical protein